MAFPFTIAKQRASVRGRRRRRRRRRHRLAFARRGSTGVLHVTAHPPCVRSSARAAVIPMPSRCLCRCLRRRRRIRVRRIRVRRVQAVVDVRSHEGDVHALPAHGTRRQARRRG